MGFQGGERGRMEEEMESVEHTLITVDPKGQFISHLAPFQPSPVELEVCRSRSLDRFV